jgi:hypothetical protein
MGSANTAAIEARMTAGSVASGAYAAGMAGAYAGGGLTDWFLPSKDELNAMDTYSLTPGFDSTTYGFAISGIYWSSSQGQYTPGSAWYDYFYNYAGKGSKNFPLQVRPVRAF